MNRTHDEAALRTQTQQAAIFELLKSGTATAGASLSHLRRLPLHALKIDVSFVRNMLRNAQDRVIVESTVGLAHNLGLNVVAEGIEDESTLAALRAMGCDEGRGYFIAPPMDAAEAGRWMHASPLAVH